MGFAGWAVAAILLPKYTNLYGRKYLFFASMLGQFVIWTALLFPFTLTSTIILTFFYSLCQYGRASIGYLYMVELLPTDPHQTTVSTLNWLNNVLVSAIICLYFLYVSKNWLWLQLFGVMLNLITLIAIFGVVPESPRWLKAKGMYQEARESIA